MKRDNMYNYGHMVRVKEIESFFVQPEEDNSPEVKEVVNPVDSFLKLVYADDPISKLPTGDLCYMASDKANPEVKAWVLANLQMDTSSAQNLKAPSGLSDDDIIELTRHPNETVEDYANRVNVFMSNNKRLVEDAIRRTKSNVPAQSSEPSVSAE